MTSRFLSTPGRIQLKTLMFLCTGNYYRSRFAELYFRHFAAKHELNWHVDSRGLQLHPDNEGPLSYHTLQECNKLGISMEPLRSPIELNEVDLIRSQLTIAIKETEHRPLMRITFPHWEQRIEYWEVHDLDVAPADETLPHLRWHIDSLIERLQALELE